LKKLKNPSDFRHRELLEFIGLLGSTGFIEFVGFVGLIDFVELFGFIGLLYIKQKTHQPFGRWVF
jgi:hypothetical protein